MQDLTRIKKRTLPMQRRLSAAEWWVMPNRCSSFLSSSLVLLTSIGLLACGDDSEKYVSASESWGEDPGIQTTSTTDDSTSGTSGGTDSGPEPEPEPESCPGYEGTCIWDSPDEMATKFQCEGEMRARFDAKSENGKVASEFPINILHDFGKEPYVDAQILACCSDDYLGGCPEEELLAPHVGACLSDCAQQSCIGLHAQIEQTVDGLPLLVQAQGIALQNYVASHIGDCTQALRAQNECAILAAEKGATFDEWCMISHLIRGRWHIPDSDDWSLIKDMSFDLECEVTDASHPDEAAETCSGVQGNNYDPPHQVLDPSLPTVVDDLNGVAQVDGALGSMSFEVSGAIELARTECAPGADCPAQLLRLSLKAQPASAGGFSLAGVQLSLRRRTTGSESQGLVSFPHNALDAELSGELIDDATGEASSFSVGVENEGTTWLMITEDALAAGFFAFSINGHRVELHTSPAPLTQG